MSDSNGSWGELARHDEEMAEVWDGFGHLPLPGENLALDSFVKSRSISHGSLIRLGARMVSATELAFAFPGGIKYRDLVTNRRWAFPGSEFNELKIVQHGPAPAAVVVVAEGETDAAWLSDRVAFDVAVLPAGADPRPHAAAYAAQLAKYELVLLGQDNDRAGDEGARVLAELLPMAVRWSPPEGANDWCEARSLPPLPSAPEPEALLVSAGELLTLEPPPIISWFERGLLPVAGQLVVHGWAKSYKSFLALDILAALAQGVPWCGFEPTEEPCRVAVMQYEIPFAYFQQRVAALRTAATRAELFDENFLIWTPMRRPSLVAGVTAAEDQVLMALDKADVQVFLLDPVRRATGLADLNSEREVRPLLHFFQRLQDNGITVVACHHDNKAYARSGGGDNRGMTGAGAFAGDADTIISVALPKGKSLDSPERNLHFTTRNAASIGPRSMTMTEEGTLNYADSPLGEPDIDSPDAPAI